MKRQEAVAKITKILQLREGAEDLKAKKVLEILEDAGIIDVRTWEQEDPEITITRSQFLALAAEAQKEEFSYNSSTSRFGNISGFHILTKKLFGNAP